jgi:cysteine sulfinate desulfinase/cysteine desulfurase-like protein
MVALGVSKEEANSLIRISLGRGSTAAEIGHFEAIFPEVIARVQRYK